MCRKNIRYFIVCLSFVVSFWCLSSFTIEAKYTYCDKKIAGTDYYDCESFAYTYYEDPINSSMIVALNDDSSILYLGKKEGIDIFYANGFRYYNVTYDDRGKDDNNVWSVISSKGITLFDGSFKDSIFIDDSHHGYYRSYLYDDVYTIRQYVNNGELYRTIVVYNVYSNKIDFKDAYYDEDILDDSIVNEVLDATRNFSVSLESKYGVKSATTKINGVEVESSLNNNNVYIDKQIVNANLIKGKTNTIEVKVMDYFGKVVSKKYKMLFLNNDVSISFSTLTSVVESSSRRIVINASPGKGKEIDNDYCWYYWSKSEDDSLVYDEFLKNYASSSYKGSYSEDKGVILRNTSGTYYLYALAKDDDSYIVVRSEGYVLNNNGYKVNYSVGDAILVVSLLILCIAPISIYLYIRKKGY